ncbi:hypothetical protein GW17_00051140, partial [Ensete ventricosum]
MGRSLSFKNWEPGVTELDLSFSGQATYDVAPQPSYLKVPVNFVLPHVKLPEQLPAFSSPRPLGELDAAATTLQKVYKSYRTRRNLADCAVVVEELCSVSFFRVEKPETAVSKWTRAKKRLAKKKKGTFQHSSFLAGGATTAAGRMVAEQGVLERRSVDDDK